MVKGRNWSSPLGLTCRAIEANVDTCTLDMNSVINRRKLILVTPAVGKAMIAFNSKDFGSFLTHPLLAAQTPSFADRGNFVFSAQGVDIQHGDGRVVFEGVFVGEKWRCELKRGSTNSRRAAIDVTHVPSEEDGTSSSSSPSLSIQDKDAIEMELTMVISQFFSDLVFELDGTFLSFQDMNLFNPKDGSGAQVLMALGITVRKFPSPGLEF